MKEYIERTVAKVKILSWAVCIDNPKLLSKEDTMYCIDNIPAANVAEVRHGHWIAEQFQTLIPVEYDEFGEPVLHDHIVYRCSQCGRVNHKKEPYCNCGARMDKEAGHEAD